MIKLSFRQALRRITWSLVVCSILFLALYVFRAPLLKELAQEWVINEPATKADAIVVLGGGLENRPFAAAALFHEGVAPLILYMDVKATAPEELGLTLSEKEQTHRILASKGVPERAMQSIGDGVHSTYDESRALRAWVEKKGGVKSIVIPTDLFHTRRARWIFRKELRDTNTEVHMVAVNPRPYGIQDWWLHEEGVIAFQNEIIKSLYYWFKY